MQTEWKTLTNRLMSIHICVCLYHHISYPFLLKFFFLLSFQRISMVWSGVVSPLSDSQHNGSRQLPAVYLSPSSRTSPRDHLQYTTHSHHHSLESTHHHQIFKCAIEDYRETIIVDCAGYLDGYGVSYDTQAGNSGLAKTKAHVLFSFFTIFKLKWRSLRVFLDTWFGNPTHQFMIQKF